MAPGARFPAVPSQNPVLPGPVWPGAAPAAALSWTRPAAPLAVGLVSDGSRGAPAVISEWTAEPGGPTGKEITKEGKQRTLEQMMSLKPGDDERTELSKRISWILRHGAKKVNVEIDAEGWVRVEDLLASEILAGTSEEKLLSVIQESNEQKTRYEVKEAPQGGRQVRAVSKSRRVSAAGRERRRRESDGGSGGEHPEREPHEPRELRRGGKGEDAGWWPQPGWSPEDGYRPGFRNDRATVGARYGEQPVRPGRQPEGAALGPPFQGGRGDRPRGRGRGKGRGEGEEGGKPEAPRERRWRVSQGQEAIVREAMAVDSEVVGTLHSGSIVAQIGEDKIMKNGIIRMLIESIEPQTGITGWATRSAEAAGGPIFFKPDRSNRERGDRADRGFGRSRGGKGFPPGKGKRPIGEGEAFDL